MTGIEEVKAYWDRRPCNIHHGTAPVGTKEYFDQVEQRKYFVEPHIPGFAEFSRWEGKKVLEVGCGIGTTAVDFARAGAIYTGIDISSESVALTRQRFKCYDLTGTILECNAEEMSHFIEEKQFDYVFSFGVIHHTPNQKAVIREIHKLIKSDGLLRIMLYAKESWKNMMIEGGLDQPEAQSGCPIAVPYTEEMVEDLLRSYFSIEDIRKTHIFPYVVEKYVNYEYEVQPWFKAMPQKMMEILEANLGWHMLITARPIK